MCRPLGKAITKFFLGGKSAAFEVVCKYQGDFACAGKDEATRLACAPLIHEAGKLGLTLPTTVEDLKDECDAHDLEKQAIAIGEAAQPEESQEADGHHDPCSRGLVGLAKKLAPNCIASCENMCRPLGKAITKFFLGGKSAAFEVVCKYQGDFACAGKDEATRLACAPLIHEAGKLGLTLPTTVEDLKDECDAHDLEKQAMAAGPEAFQEVASGRDHCHHGLVGQVRKLAPDCIDACHHICGPLGEAIRGFLFGGVERARKAVCRHEAAFRCAVLPENVDKCMPFATEAAKFGFILPTSEEGLTDNCTSPTPSLAFVSATAETENHHDACNHGLVRQVKNLAPECINACRSMCGPLGKAISGFFRGGKHRAMEEVCAHQEEFACVGEHIEVCMPLIEAAKDVGLYLPTTAAALETTCAEGNAPAFLEVEAENHHDACNRGLVRQVKNLAPDCINACRSMCGPLGKAISGYFRGGKDRATQEVCAHQEEFACVGEHIEICMPLVEAAEGLHLVLPTTAEELSTTCSQYDMEMQAMEIAF